MKILVSKNVLKKITFKYIKQNLPNFRSKWFVEYWYGKDWKNLKVKGIGLILMKKIVKVLKTTWDNTKYIDYSNLNENKVS